MIPRAHSKNLWEVDDADLHHGVGGQAPGRTNAGRALLRGINLLNATRQRPGWSVFHFHMHVIPRYDDDPLKLPVQPRRAKPEELSAVAAELRG